MRHGQPSRDRRRPRIVHSVRCLAAVGVALLFATRLAAAPYQGPGTKRMAERLKEINEQSNARNNLYQNGQRAEMFGEELKKALAGPDAPGKGTNVLELESKYATEWLLAGRTREAIEEFIRLDLFPRGSNVQFGSETRSSLRHFLAIAYLRLGEQENCLTNHTIDSCLMPIRGAGVHKIQRGSRKALELLSEQLTEFPDDLKARWLLNRPEE